MNKLIYLLPIVTLAVLSYLHYQAFYVPKVHDLISRTTPDFDLPEIYPNHGETYRFRNADLPKKPVLINIFASWCSTCIIENRRLKVLKNMHGVEIFGLAYRDDKKSLDRFIKDIGNPYQRIGLDTKGHEVLKWNLSGLPHTLLIDAEGKIRYHHKGLMDYNDINTIILPLMKRLDQE